MPHEYDVLVYGTVCLDAIWRVQALAPPGGYAPILEEKKLIGGEAANTAIALTKWGVKVALVGNALGDDDYGRLLRELFARDAPELDTRFLATMPDARTPFCACIATPDGHRTMYGTGFSEMQCPALDPELARSARFFTLDPNAWGAGLRACAVAAEVGAPIVAMDYTREEAVNRAAHLIVTSIEHIGADRPVEEYRQFAARLRDTCGPTTIITRGEKGCLAAERGGRAGETTAYPAYVAPEMADATGCGDVFRAGLLYGLLQEWDIPKTVRFASAAAALNCGAMGGWCGVRSVAEIEAFQRAAAFHEGG